MVNFNIQSIVPHMRDAVVEVKVCESLCFCNDVMCVLIFGKCYYHTLT